MTAECLLVPVRNSSRVLPYVAETKRDGSLPLSLIIARKVRAFLFLSSHHPLADNLVAGLGTPEVKGRGAREKYVPPGSDNVPICLGDGQGPSERSSLLSSPCPSITSLLRGAAFRFPGERDDFLGVPLRRVRGD